jgi:serine protease Do
MRIKYFWVLCLPLLSSLPTVAAKPWRPHFNPANLRDTITVQVVRHCRGAVVSITAKRIVTRRLNPFGNMFWNPFGAMPLGLGPVQQFRADFLGSGFIIQKSGYIVTNNHVVDQARSISVTLADGRKFPAQVIGVDPHADLAILKIDAPHPLPTLPLGDSHDLMIGEPVIAVGNPFGYSQSVSSGIVSATNRQIREPNNPVPLTNLIQTDAAINPGNSGGPLLNAYGQVIGINTAIRGNAQNIGFAIGVDRLVKLIPKLMNPAQIRHVNLIGPGKPSRPLCLAALRQPIGPADIRVEVVRAGTRGPALSTIDGRSAATLVDAYAALLRAAATRKMVVLRFANGRTRDYAVVPVPPSPVLSLAWKMLGLGLQQVTPALAHHYHLAASSGLLVRRILGGSVAARAGVQPGDVVVQLGPYRIRTLRDLGLLLPHLAHAGDVKIMVLRNGRYGIGTLSLH